MSTLMKIMLVPALVVAFSVGVALAASGGGDDQLAQVAPTSSTIEDSTTTDATTTTATGVDVSGPCDEAEHANDPRCTGAGDDGRHGNSGPGNAEDSGDDDNSGPGSGNDDDDDRSGHGDGDDRDADSSGPGGDDR